MGWVKIDDQFFHHSKIIDLSDKAKLLFVAGLCHCNENMTDGFISANAARSIAGFLGAQKKVTTELVDAGLWHKRADGFDVHDYLEYQPSAEQERRRRADTKDRVRNLRQRRRSTGKGTGNAVGNATGNGVTPPVTNAARTTTPVPVPLVLTSRSDLHGWAPDVATTESEAQKAIELIEWLWEVMAGQSLAKPDEVIDVVCWAMSYLDGRIVEEAIGYLRGLPEPPRGARYVAKTLRSWGEQRGVKMPEWRGPPSG